MKKLLLLFLTVVGFVGTAKADFYVFYGYDYDTNWGSLCTLTDSDEDGIFSVDLNLESADKLSWGSLTIVLSKESTLGDNWANVLWANLADRTSILSSDEFELSDTYSAAGKLYIPITEVTPNTYAIRLNYDSENKKLSASRLVEFASSNDDWHTSNPIYLVETAHNSKIFRNELLLPANTEFKFVVNGNSNDKSGQAVWYGYNSGDYISEGDNINNMSVKYNGLYKITAQLTDYNYVAPELVKLQVSTAGTYGMATLCSEYALDFTDFSANNSVIRAYTITAHTKATGELTKNQITGKVPANTGLYIEGTSAYVPVTTYTESIDDNMLVGVTVDTHIDQTAGIYTNYILTVNKATGNVDVPKFYKVNGTDGNTVLANRAYLQIPTTLATREMLWFGGDEATSMNDVKAKANTVKGEVYDLQGRRVANPMKGLYIVNGKKVIF